MRGANQWLRSYSLGVTVRHGSAGRRLFQQRHNSRVFPHWVLSGHSSRRCEMQSVAVFATKILTHGHKLNFGPRVPSNGLNKRGHQDTIKQLRALQTPGEKKKQSRGEHKNKTHRQQTVIFNRLASNPASLTEPPTC